ncbi:MAG: 5-deoxy-glucuronate isomerase [Sporomusaceae bacterium]|nr:5-deoxy-glucuronate isomerase [Sporomusaceae bacterium]
MRLGDGPEYIGLGLLRLSAGAVHKAATAGEEVVLVVLSGVCDVAAGAAEFTTVGGRSDVFAGRASSVYVPINTAYSVTAAGGRPVEVAVLSAKAERKFSPFAVRPDEVVVAHRGALNWQRDVHDIVTGNADGRVDRIIVGETFAYPGQWSSYPSHKHDVHEPPHEGLFEEIYLFKVKPAGGFGVQIMYSDDLSLREAFMLKDGDAVFLPRGYHPVGAAPGCQLYYLWVMAGPHGRKLVPRDDPNLAWLQNVPPMLK